MVIPQQSIGNANKLLVRLELPQFFLLPSALQTSGFAGVDGLLGYRFSYLLEILRLIYAM